MNGAGSRETTTLFSGDSIQTGDDSVANTIVGESSILVLPNASVKFLGNMVELIEGGIAIATSVGMAVKADDLTITPATLQLSRFEVAEAEDSVAVAARQGNLIVNDGQQTSTIAEGHERRARGKRLGPFQLKAAACTRFLGRRSPSSADRREQP